MCLAVPGRVEEIYEGFGSRMAKVNFGGVIKEVCLAYVPEIAVGEYTIVHVGFAISRIDEAEARQTLDLFREMGMLDEEFAAEQRQFERAAASPPAECDSAACQPGSKEP
ncbi:MAG: HypC/HybG/HupF family hydrogenase formation chaperone [Bryobacteraceae bacterium]